MITTGCEGCCFLKQDNKGKGCSLGQMCVVEDGRVFAPGHCKTCRNYKWAGEQNTTNVLELYNKVLEELILRLDLIVLFDETINTTDDLTTTLQSDWYREYAQKVIVADVTGFDNRKNLAVKYLRSIEHEVPTVVDSSVSSEINQRAATLCRISKQVTAPFFMVVQAGDILSDMDMFAAALHCDKCMTALAHSRVIHWSFPLVSGQTAISPNQLDLGLFVTSAYKKLIKKAAICSDLSEPKSFTEQLRIEEIDTGMNLSWFCEKHWWIS